MSHLLFFRGKKLSLQYAIRLAANLCNPAHEVTFTPYIQSFMKENPIILSLLVIEFFPLLESANINDRNVEKEDIIVEKEFTSNIPACCIHN